jgi:hypothetical protein
MLKDLVKHILLGDDLSARQWIKDIRGRGKVVSTAEFWSNLPKPDTQDPFELAVAAGVVSLFCARENTNLPEWVAGVAPAPEEVYVDPVAYDRPRLKALLKAVSPKELSQFNVYGPAKYLDVL